MFTSLIDLVEHLPVEYRNYITWNRHGTSLLYSANVMHTAILLLKTCGYTEIVYGKRINKQAHQCTLEELYDRVSFVLEQRGKHKYTSLTGKSRGLTLVLFKADVNTYLQECSPDYKQYHFYRNKYVGHLRSDCNSRLYRPVLISCEESWYHQMGGAGVPFYRKRLNPATATRRFTSPTVSHHLLPPSIYKQTEYAHAHRLPK